MRILFNIWRRITRRNRSWQIAESKMKHHGTVFDGAINVDLIGTMPDTMKNEPNLTPEEKALRAEETRRKVREVALRTGCELEKKLRKTTFTPYNDRTRYKAAA
jgi:hypothetical protein